MHKPVKGDRRGLLFLRSYESASWMWITVYRPDLRPRDDVTPSAIGLAAERWIYGRPSIVRLDLWACAQAMVIGLRGREAWRALRRALAKTQRSRSKA